MTKHIDKNLDDRIQAFLTKKMQKYPELNVRHRDSKTVSMPHLTFHALHTTRLSRA